MFSNSDLVVGPIADGHFLPKNIDSDFIASVASIDLLAGVTSHEGYFLSTKDFPDLPTKNFSYDSFLKNLNTFLTVQYGKCGDWMKDIILELYGCNLHKDNLKELRWAAIQIVSDITILAPSYRMVELHSSKHRSCNMLLLIFI